MIVRKAELWDVPALFELAERFHGEAKIKYPLPEPLAIYQTVFETKHCPQLFCFVVEQNEQIIGFIVGGTCRLAHSFHTIASPSMFYVDKRKRGTRAAKLLFESYLGWCWKNRVSVKVLAPISGIRTKQMCRFIEKYGFKKTGFAYVC